MYLKNPLTFLNLPERQPQSSRIYKQIAEKINRIGEKKAERFARYRGKTQSNYTSQISPMMRDIEIKTID